MDPEQSGGVNEHTSDQLVQHEENAVQEEDDAKISSPTAELEAPTSVSDDPNEMLKSMGICTKCKERPAEVRLRFFL